MNFTHYDLGPMNGGETVEVTLAGNSANVRLLDRTNFQRYRSGQQHHYFGGHARQSPYLVQVPSAGHWHIVIDLGGYRGRVKTGIRVLSATH
jgi:hypothetical protein